MAQNLNVVAITANLTKDPELRALPSGTSVCSLRVACNTATKQNDEWVDKPNYFDVTVWGKQGENCAKYLVKGKPVAIQGRLEWREWQTDDGSKRQVVQIVADRVQFLRAKGDDDSGGATHTDVPAPDMSSAASTPDTSDDIPF